MLLAISAGAVAWPVAFVNAVADADDPKVALAPVDGAVKVTVAPLTGFPAESVTVTCSPVLNAVFTVALCGVPALAATFGLESAAALKLTEPVPDAIVQLTLTVCPAVEAWYVNV